METLFIIYDELFDEDVRAIIERGMVIPRYSRIDDVIGARTAEMQHQVSYLDDRRNRMIVAIAESAVIAQIVGDLRLLRDREGHGLRAFVVPVLAVV